MRCLRDGVDGSTSAMSPVVTSEPVWRFLRRRGVVLPHQLLEHFEIRTPPIDVDYIASRLEVYVHRVSGMAFAGAVNSNRRGAHIFISKKDHPWRQRFTIAHELGHLMLHRDGSLHHRDTTFAGSPAEQQANRFAADLLMPRAMMPTAMTSSGGSIKRLARLFDVSEAAMSVRVGNLGLERRR